MTYAEKLLDPRWQKKRLQVLERANFTCELCSDKETTLHVHHEVYNNEPWDAPLDKLKCYCKHCHLLIEAFKKKPLPSPIKIDKIDAILFIEMYAFIKVDSNKYLVYGNIKGNMYEILYIISDFTMNWVINVFDEI